jgi:tetratricopeptide (TPR) repeat protein
VELGDAALAERSWAEADAYYVRALGASPQDPGAIHGRARVATRLRKPEQALRHFSRLAHADRAWFEGKARDDYTVALIEAGRTRMARRDPKAALDVIRIAYALRPDQAGMTDLYAKALSGSAAKHAMHGQRKQAAALYDEAMKAAPHDVDAYVGKAEILIAVGKRKEALALLIDARKQAPSDRRIRALTVEAMGLY